MSQLGSTGFGAAPTQPAFGSSPTTQQTSFGTASPSTGGFGGTQPQSLAGAGFGGGMAAGFGAGNSFGASPTKAFGGAQAQATAFGSASQLGSNSMFAGSAPAPSGFAVTSGFGAYAAGSTGPGAAAPAAGFGNAAAGSPAAGFGNAAAGSPAQGFGNAAAGSFSTQQQSNAFGNYRS